MPLPCCFCPFPKPARLHVLLQKSASLFNGCCGTALPSPDTTRLTWLDFKRDNSKHNSSRVSSSIGEYFHHNNSIGEATGKLSPNQVCIGDDGYSGKAIQCLNVKHFPDIDIINLYSFNILSSYCTVHLSV